MPRHTLYSESRVRSGYDHFKFAEDHGLPQQHVVFKHEALLLEFFACVCGVLANILFFTVNYYYLIFRRQEQHLYCA